MIRDTIPVNGYVSNVYNLVSLGNIIHDNNSGSKVSTPISP